jgi:hypothetical protein
MNAKKLLIIAALALVAFIYYYLYKDSFKKAEMKIRVTMRPRIGPRMRAPRNANAAPGEDNVIFVLSGEYKLTSIEVIPQSDAATNKFPHPIWQLISDSNSVPTSTFVYGRGIRGMHPQVKGAVADPLEPSTGYRVVVKAGSTKGEHDFTTPAEDNPPQ